VAAECAADIGDADRADAAIQAAGKSLSAAETAYLRGRVAEIRGERDDAFTAYDKALAEDPDHARATFRRARLEALYGDEDNAVDLYRRCVELPCPPRNAWLNLGCIYEDRGEFTKARDCFRNVLDGDPTDTRARMFDKDAAAAQDMFYDEDLERRSDKRAAILRLPVTDFELSVRSRNCLAKMGVRTLGDLIQKTEAELLSYKNFGETSLQEIKDVLAQKGLRLGMTRDEIARESQEARTMLEGIGSEADRRKLLQKPLAELELSVRSRHCMNVLGLKSVGELCAKSESELMTIKNFGQTSLNEVKQKLAEIGLSLAPNPVK
jgi:DNA-directed RNA polymerase subunit alpha